jgi:hypothetical protein
MSALFVAVTPEEASFITFNEVKLKDGCPSVKFQWTRIKNSVVPTWLEIRHLNSNETIVFNVSQTNKSVISVSQSEVGCLVAGDSYLASVYFNYTTNITRADLQLTTSEYLNNFAHFATEELL